MHKIYHNFFNRFFKKLEYNTVQMCNIPDYVPCNLQDILSICGFLTENILMTQYYHNTLFFSSKYICKRISMYNVKTIKENIPIYQLLREKPYAYIFANS